MDSNRLTTSDMPEIDWKTKNFPPGLSLINYNLSALTGRIEKFCKKAYWAFLSTVLYFMLNLLSSLIQFSHKTPSTWRFIFCLIINPIIISWSFYNFYTGYRAVCWNNYLLKKFLIQEIPLAILLFSGFIFDYLSFDGIIYAINLWISGVVFVPSFIVPFELFILGIGLTMRGLTIYESIKWNNLQENEISLNENSKDNINKESEMEKSTNIGKDQESYITGEISHYIMQTGNRIIGKKYLKSGQITDMSCVSESEQPSKIAGSKTLKSVKTMKSRKNIRNNNKSKSKSPIRGKDQSEITSNTGLDIESKFGNSPERSWLGIRDINWFKKSKCGSPTKDNMRKNPDNGISFNLQSPIKRDSNITPERNDKIDEENSKTGSENLRVETPIILSKGNSEICGSKTEKRQVKNIRKDGF